MGRMGGNFATEPHRLRLTDAFIGKAGSQIAPFRWIAGC